MADVDIDKVLDALRMIESSGGKNTHHKTVTSGTHKGDTAIGDFGLMPKTAYSLAQKDPDLAEFKGRQRPELEALLAGDPQLQRRFARELTDEELRGFHGDPRAAAVSHYSGPEAGKRLQSGGQLTPEEADYLKKFDSFIGQHGKGDVDLDAKARKKGRKTDEEKAILKGDERGIDLDALDRARGLPTDEERASQSMQGPTYPDHPAPQAANLTSSGIMPSSQSDMQAHIERSTGMPARQSFLDSPAAGSFPQDNPFDVGRHLGEQMPPSHSFGPQQPQMGMQAAPQFQRSPQAEINTRIAQDSPFHFDLGGQPGGAYMGDVHMAEGREQMPPQQQGIDQPWNPAWGGIFGGKWNDLRDNPAYDPMGPPNAPFVPQNQGIDESGQHPSEVALQYHMRSRDPQGLFSEDQRNQALQQAMAALTQQAPQQGRGEGLLMGLGKAFAAGGHAAGVEPLSRAYGIVNEQEQMRAQQQQQAAEASRHRGSDFMNLLEQDRLTRQGNAGMDEKIHPDMIQFPGGQQVPADHAGDFAQALHANDAPRQWQQEFDQKERFGNARIGQGDERIDQGWQRIENSQTYQAGMLEARMQGMDEAQAHHLATLAARLADQDIKAGAPRMSDQQYLARAAQISPQVAAGNQFDLGASQRPGPRHVAGM